MKKLHIKLTYTEPLLGTSPANEDIYRDFIGSGVEKQCGELKITKWRNQNENNHN
mgnify:CR=1 FL=1|jgi:hypothetical protein